MAATNQIVKPRSGGSGPQATGLAMLRIALGIFFVALSVTKMAWYADSGILAKQLSGWLSSAGPISRWYLETVAIPWVGVWARLVPLGELATGVAFLTGAWTRTAASLALLMVLSIHIAGGALFQWRFLTNGYGPPVLGGLLALALGGKKLPLSLR